MWRCGCLSTQPWWRPYSVAWMVVTRGAPKRRARWSPAIATSQSWPWTRSKSIPVAELDPGGEHVGVHPLDPGDELAEVGRVASARGRGGCGRRRRSPPAGDSSLPRVSTWTSAPARDEALGELAHVTGEPALDQRRVLPGEDQHGGQRRRSLWAAAPRDGVRAPAGGRGSGQAPGCAAVAAAGARRVYRLEQRASVAGAALPGIVAGLAATSRNAQSLACTASSSRSRPLDRGSRRRPVERPQHPQLQPPRGPGQVGDRGRVPGAKVLALAPARRSSARRSPGCRSRASPSVTSSTPARRPRPAPPRARPVPPTTSGRAARCRSRTPAARDARAGRRSARRRAATAATNSPAELARAALAALRVVRARPPIDQGRDPRSDLR